MRKCSCPTLSGITTLAGVGRRLGKREKSVGLGDLAAPVMLCNEVRKTTRKVCSFANLPKEERAEAVVKYLNTSGPIESRCSSAGGTLAQKEVTLCDGRKLNVNYRTEPFRAGSRTFKATYTSPLGKRVSRGAQVAIYRRKLEGERLAKARAALEKARAAKKAKKASE